MRFLLAQPRRLASSTKAPAAFLNTAAKSGARRPRRRSSNKSNQPQSSHFKRLGQDRSTSQELKETVGTVLRRYGHKTKPSDFAFSASDVSRSFERLPYYEANPHVSVPTLLHGLEEVLKTPNTVHLLRSNNSQAESPEAEEAEMDKEVRHIDAPDLDVMPRPSDINMSVVSHFVPPSGDPQLGALARQRLKSGLRFAGSTSSVGGPLVQIWALLNPMKDLHMDGLFSGAFDDMPRALSAGILLPPSVKLTHKDGVWFVDADKDAVPETPNDLLSALGHVGEKLFTTTAEEFAKYKLEAKHENQEAWEKEQKEQPQAYAYSQHGALLMRSQIDSCFSEEPHKTFDIKTRATISIRLDRLNADQGSYYQLKRQSGRLESYERENYDLMRSAYLKYSMQARIGGMAGIFIGHHNTRQVFGFQYLELEDMDKVTSGSHLEAEHMFHLCVGTLESILRLVVPQDPSISQCSVTFRAVSGQKELQVFREAPNQPTQMWTIWPKELPGKGNGYTVKYSVLEEKPSRAHKLREQCLKRQRQFNVAYLPAIPELTAEQLEEVEAHNRAQKSGSEEPEEDASDMDADESDSPREKSASSAAAPSTLPFALVPGITYIYPNTAHLKALRKLSQASMDQAQAFEAKSETDS